MVRRLFLSRFAQLAALPFASAGSSSRTSCAQATEDRDEERVGL
jgi:antitoxin component of RelBE/YafQ-DinJ toxin-antitoxin module